MTRQVCHWHQGHTDRPTLIALIETGSGPGAILYACPDCMHVHQLLPFAPAASGAPVCPRRPT
ncbi:hypothetical protein [Streptomyces sp. bgisy100]|uniref:hypothetical protein n=1 Tax=Streptomyces sp. bgisy100 TaxID=3413783 RepID=UPI003D70287A